MSKNEKGTEQQEQKIVTKYDRKMQQRKEEKEKAKKEQRKSAIIGVVVLVAVICFVAYFPIRNYLAVNETYVKVGGEDVTRVEFDYSYNLAYNNYMNNYGMMMSYMGVDLSGDLSTQMYSDELSWKDFFDQMAVDNLTQTKALMAEVRAAGFTYDTTEQYKQFEEEVKAGAAEMGLSVKDYVRALYGNYATLGRIEEFVKNDIILSQFVTQKTEEFAPAAEEIQAHYESYPEEYDSVDYRVTSVKAELPTEPTELADPVEETTVSEGNAETAYQPSEAEIAKAMKDAKKKAEAAEAKVATEGELQENVTGSYVTSLIRDWLFDDARKAGDTTIIEDSTNNQYYVLAFEKRYLDETPTADVRIIITEGADGQTVLDEWKNGAATEDSFVELCAQYSIDTTASIGGLVEGVSKTGLPEQINAWLFEEGRATGDTVAIASEDGTYSYIMYYIGQNEPAWKLNIKNTILSVDMNNYINECMAKIEVEDPKGNLKYLTVEVAE